MQIPVQVSQPNVQLNTAGLKGAIWEDIFTACFRIKCANTVGL